MVRTVIGIEIVSDVVCPWCYLGQGRLGIALQRVADRVEADISWRPYQLEPDAPPEGFDTFDYLARKIGGEAAVRRSHETLKGLGAEIGLPFALEKATRFPNTLDAHRLIHWAGLDGAAAQDRVVRALFAANFVDGLDVGDRHVLLDIAARSGLDSETIERKLSDGSDVDTVRGEIDNARRMGISGVPCFIFDRQYAVTGAQSVDVFENVLRQLVSQKTMPE